jgi:DNA adenine methylase
MLTDEHVRVIPFLRWAGGKQWLAPVFSTLCLPTKSTYFEPFLGGGAAFFSAWRERAVLGDINAALISTYEAVRDNPRAVIRHLRSWANKPSTFYAVRAAAYRGKYKTAAAFIYLNKTCWNGLHRVNRSGRFNVPFGYNQNRAVYDSKAILSASRWLKTADLMACDFEVTLSRCHAGDIVYLDPPYTLRHASNGFRRYNEKLFSWSDQRRLSALVDRLVSEDCHVVLSNALHEDILRLYPRMRAFKLSRKSLLAGRADCRGTTYELLLVSPSLAGRWSPNFLEGLCRIR